MVIIKPIDWFGRYFERRIPSFSLVSHLEVDMASNEAEAPTVGGLQRLKGTLGLEGRNWASGVTLDVPGR